MPSFIFVCTPDPPDAPGEPEVDEVGGDFVSLTWQKPRSDGGGGIIGYYIEKKDADSDNWIRVNHAPTPAAIFNVPNLIEDREYDFRVFAVNDAGESKPAATSRKVKVKDPKGLQTSLCNSIYLHRKIMKYIVHFPTWQ